eukprot:9318092-Pyramimonas_sp.AAC.1
MGTPLRLAALSASPLAPRKPQVRALSRQHGACAEHALGLERPWALRRSLGEVARNGGPRQPLAGRCLMPTPFWERPLLPRPPSLFWAHGPPDGPAAEAFFISSVCEGDMGPSAAGGWSAINCACERC